MAMNPFRYGCVVAGENFCPRPELQRQLCELLKSGQNVVVQGPRRMGKTSLVCETVKSIRGMKLLYVDLFCVRTIGEFCRRVVLAASKCGSGKSFLETIASLVKGLRPVLSFDRDSGVPSLSVDVQAAKDASSIEEVMGMIAKIASGKSICVVFDEFQDMLDLPDADVVIARLRSQIQFLPSTPFVFLGSVRNTMHTIFSSPQSPFFKSAIGFEVDRIERERFRDFLVERFAAGERKITSEVVELLMDYADGISGDVQELAETTWLVTETNSTISKEDVARGLEMVFARDLQSFSFMQEKLTTIQLSVLCGIARNSHAKVFSSDFLRQNGIKNVGSVTRALTRLQDEGYLFGYQNEYRFENPFFRAWLIR